VKWRKGCALTADDVARNLKRVCDPKVGSSMLGLFTGYLIEEFATGEIRRALSTAFRTSAPASIRARSQPFPDRFSCPAGCLFGPRRASFERVSATTIRDSRLSLQAKDTWVRCVRWQEVARAQAALPACAVDDASTEAEIEVLGISKLYNVGYHKTLKANEAVSFVAAEAEIVALVDESGCGKSTLARIVTSLVARATSGEIRMAPEHRHAGSKPAVAAPASVDPDDIPESGYDAEPVARCGLFDSRLAQEIRHQQRP
jgi:ABC-type multidrug transport system fused ATPase/permease subunit